METWKVIIKMMYNIYDHCEASELFFIPSGEDVCKTQQKKIAFFLAMYELTEVFSFRRKSERGDN